MSTKRRNKNKNSKKRSQRRNAARKGGNRRTSMRGAPIAISDDMQQYTYFTSHNRGIKMHTNAAIYQVASTATTALGGAALTSITNGYSTSAQLNLTSPQGVTTAGVVSDQAYISPVWDLISSAFVRYRVEKLVFHYEPQAKSTTDGRLVFSFAADPLHPVLWAASLIQNDLLSVSDSIAFMPWKSWSMDVTDRLDNTLYYTYSDPGTVLLGFTERFSDFGVISCISDTEAATPILSGVLYMETCVVLEEFCPISIVRPTMARKLIKRLARAAVTGDRTPKRPEKIEDKNDICVKTNVSSGLINQSSVQTSVSENGAIVIKL